MKFFLGIVVGITISSLVFILYLYPSTKSSWKNQGYNDGEIAAKSDIANSLKNEFKPYQEEKIIKTLFNIKATSVYIVESNGEKSIRVHD